MTIRELWQSLRDEGFQVDVSSCVCACVCVIFLQQVVYETESRTIGPQKYHRIAISSDEAPENRYLDDFLAVLRDVDTNVSLYFNCGVGVVRTT